MHMLNVFLFEYRKQIHGTFIVVEHGIVFFFPPFQFDIVYKFKANFAA